MQFSVISYVTTMYQVTMLPCYHVTLWLIPHLHIYVWYICSIKLLTYLILITYLHCPYNTNVAYIDTAGKTDTRCLKTKLSLCVVTSLKHTRLLCTFPVMYIL